MCGLCVTEEKDYFELSSNTFRICLDLTLLAVSREVF